MAFNAEAKPDKSGFALLIQSALHLLPEPAFLLALLLSRLVVHEAQAT
jgi:hypothetical protein